MTPESIIDLFRTTMFNVIVITSIIVMPGLILGLVISVFQAATQINEQGLSFIPKLLLTLVVLIVAGPWLLNILINFTESLIANIGEHIA